MGAFFNNNYNISFEFRPDYLFVEVDLPVNEYNVARQYWTEVVRMIHRGRYVRAVIEISAQAALPAADARSLMSDFLKIIYPGIKIAVVNPWVTAEVRSSIEGVATKLGRSLKIVDDRAAADDWILADPRVSAPADPQVVGSRVEERTRSAAAAAPRDARPSPSRGWALHGRPLPLA